MNRVPRYFIRTATSTKAVMIKPNQFMRPTNAMIQATANKTGSHDVETCGRGGGTVGRPCHNSGGGGTLGRPCHNWSADGCGASLFFQECHSISAATMSRSTPMIAGKSIGPYSERRTD